LDKTIRFQQALTPDPKRVVVLPFQMSINTRESATTAVARMKRICAAILAMDEATCEASLTRLRNQFASRHRQLFDIFKERFNQIKAAVGGEAAKENQSILIGAYFSHEYSFQAAAILNPSVVASPNQDGVARGDVRFILSTRCVGEGHISTIAFREGIFHGDGAVTLDAAPSVAIAALPQGELTGEGPVTLARAPGTNLAETVIFPATRSQVNGLEDLRLTDFSGEPARRFIGTYTAFSGRELRCEMFETADFATFKLLPMSGSATYHKALAFFPRKINGKYAAIGRLDHESLYYLESDSLTHWESGQLILKPKESWELMQVGNCGSPIELDEGWLVITHGVGPVRQYALGAVLLDKANPAKVLGRTRQPLLEPAEETRDGYAPNTIYSCGSLRAGDWLFLPHALADTHIDFFSIRIADILAQLSPA
jgi:predicted GH43/DUF377 family glycosyl hydrolase